MRTNIGIDPHAEYLSRVVDVEARFRYSGGLRSGILLGDYGGYADLSHTKISQPMGAVDLRLCGPQGGEKFQANLNSSETRYLIAGLNIAHRHAFHGEDAFILAADR